MSAHAAHVKIVFSDLVDMILKRVRTDEDRTQLQLDLLSEVAECREAFLEQIAVITSNREKP